MSQKGQKLQYGKNGKAFEVLEIVDFDVPVPKETEVVVEVIMSPINPSDITTLEGSYAAKPKLPAGAGNEGLGKVIAVGSKVKKVAVGDIVTSMGGASTGEGWWRTHHVFEEQTTVKFPADVDLDFAATSVVNPTTALRLMSDYGLKPGDSFIQNGGNSSVGEAVIQIASQRGYKSINVIRDRDDAESMKRYLEKLGATLVLTESELKSGVRLKLMDIPPPRLVLDCVSGAAVLPMIPLLGQDALIVNYGAMSGQPLMIPPTNLIFKGLKVEGFWLTSWAMKAGIDGMAKMMAELGKMNKEGKLKAPSMERFALKDFKKAASRHYEGGRQGKATFDLRLD